jgi:glycosyltransferase involved in cell wall biosynthesis
VVTDVGSIPESVDHGHTGLVVPPHDKDALAEALIAVLTDDELQARLSAGATAMAAGPMSWSVVAEKQERLLHEAVSHHARRSRRSS